MKKLTTIILISLLLTLQSRSHVFPDSALITNAWNAFNQKDYENALIYAEECINSLSAEAQKQQKNLDDFAPPLKAFDYEALNEVGSSMFIKAESLKSLGKIEEAKKVFNELIQKYPFSQCWYKKEGLFWPPAEVAKDRLVEMQYGIDYEDYAPETLTNKAWQSYNEKHYGKTEFYAEKCIQLYAEQAKKMQQQLKEFPSKEKAFDYWALNHVGTCYFILGEAYSAKKDFKKAYYNYSKLVKEYYFSQCWDPKGWFWKPAISAQKQINTLSVEHGEILH